MREYRTLLALFSAHRRAASAKRSDRESGKVGWFLLWLIGIPIPVLVILFLLRGCT